MEKEKWFKTNIKLLTYSKQYQTEIYVLQDIKKKIEFIILLNYLIEFRFKGNNI